MGTSVVPHTHIFSTSIFLHFFQKDIKTERRKKSKEFERRETNITVTYRALPVQVRRHQIERLKRKTFEVIMSLHSCANMYK